MVLLILVLLRFERWQKKKEDAFIYVDVDDDDKVIVLIKRERLYLTQPYQLLLLLPYRLWKQQFGLDQQNSISHTFHETKIQNPSSRCITLVREIHSFMHPSFFLMIKFRKVALLFHQMTKQKYITYQYACTRLTPPAPVHLVSKFQPFFHEIFNCSNTSSIS